MKIMLLLLCLPLAALASEIKVLTWNTYLIPAPWNFTKQKARSNAMKNLLPTLTHDVMFFQEAFHDKYRNRLINGLKATHPYSAVPRKGKKLKHLQDSGLFIVSKIPMNILDQVIFDECAKADCASSKSAILVELSLRSGEKIHMINTHLQAWDKEIAVNIRRSQLQQIKNMMNQHFIQGVPQVLVGDLNVDGLGNVEYPAALALMEMTSSPLMGELNSTNGYSTKSCFKKPGEDHPEWLDHIWVKANGSMITVENKKVLPMSAMINGIDCPLSDHHAVEAMIKL